MPTQLAGLLAWVCPGAASDLRYRHRGDGGRRTPPAQPAGHREEPYPLALKEILQVAALPEDWDTYGSPSPAPRLVDTCIALVDLVDDLPVPRVVPIPEGGIQLEWTTGERELEVAVLPEGHIEFLRTQGGELVDEGKLGVQDYGQFLSLLTWISDPPTMQSLAR